MLNTETAEKYQAYLIKKTITRDEIIEILAKVLTKPEAAALRIAEAGGVRYYYRSPRTNKNSRTLAARQPKNLDIPVVSTPGMTGLMLKKLEDHGLISTVYGTGSFGSFPVKLSKLGAEVLAASGK